MENEDYQPQYTHIEKVPGRDIWLKRDDEYEVAGVRGGKARTCWNLAKGAKMLVTASSRRSPQIQIVSHIAHKLGIPCRCHTPQGKYSPEMEDAASLGAEIIQHKAGYNNVIIRRSLDDFYSLGGDDKATYIPFGMECAEAVKQTAKQAMWIPNQLHEMTIKRVVVIIGSGMSCAGILTGMKAWPIACPVLGIQVGAHPEERLSGWAPFDWHHNLTIEKSKYDYHEPCEDELPGVKLDPHYEAKAVEYLRPGDLFWIVGIRNFL